ncbi:Glutathione synthetase [Xanthoria parietina]
MGASIYPDFPPKTTLEQQDYLLSNIKDWSILNGLAIRPSTSLLSTSTDLSGTLAATAPVTLYPSLFPRACFHEARAIQKAYNELYAAIARDQNWLRQIVQQLIEVDDFIASLWNVHLEVEKEGYVQNLSLGLFRSDYMVHTDPANPDSKPTIKQVEFNTIASSFGGLSTKVSQLHSYLNEIAAYPPTSPPTIAYPSFPANPCIESLSHGFSTAHRAYGPSKSSPSLPLCILFIVTVPESNIFDQLALSTPLQTAYEIPTFRLAFSAILDHTTVSSNKHRILNYSPPHSPEMSYEVSLVYFRAGYSPSHYPSSASWDARLHLERSAAIKCPSILTHLAGSKKIQQELATPNSPHLANFLSRTSSADLIDRIRNTFTAIYPLDDTPEGQHAIRLATSAKDSEGYVLKPQREGGGNNVYGSKIPAFLAGLGDDQQRWRSHILMELIKPPTLRNSILRNGEVQSGEVIGELGVYGVCLWRNGHDEAGGKKNGGDADGEVLENWEAGFLLRTKGSESEEGGVAAGFGAVDSPCLVDV